MVFSRLSTDVQRQMADLQIPNAQHTMDPTRFSFSLTEGARFTAIIRRKGPGWGKGISATAISFFRCKNSVGKKTSVNRHGTGFFCHPRVIHQLCQGLATKISKSFGAPQPDTGCIR